MLALRYAPALLMAHATLNSNFLSIGILPKRRAEYFEQFRSGECPILVCTDIASRGLDTVSVDHVVLFDFPETVTGYLHRVGRTARGGRRGRVTCLLKKGSISHFSDSTICSHVHDCRRKGVRRGHRVSEQEADHPLRCAAILRESKPAATQAVDGMARSVGPFAQSKEHAS